MAAGHLTGLPLLAEILLISCKLGPLGVASSLSLPSQ